MHVWHPRKRPPAPAAVNSWARNPLALLRQRGAPRSEDIVLNLPERDGNPLIDAHHVPYEEVILGLSDKAQEAPPAAAVTQHPNGFYNASRCGSGPVPSLERAASFSPPEVAPQHAPDSSAKAPSSLKGNPASAPRQHGHASASRHASVLGAPATGLQRDPAPQHATGGAPVRPGPLSSAVKRLTVCEYDDNLLDGLDDDMGSAMPPPPMPQLKRSALAGGGSVGGATRTVVLVQGASRTFSGGPVDVANNPRNSNAGRGTGVAVQQTTGHAADSPGAVPWYERLDEFMGRGGGSVDAAQGPHGTGSCGAGVQRRRTLNGGVSAPPRQALLTSDGRCALPPPAPGSWAAQRVAMAGSGSGTAASGGVQQQQEAQGNQQQAVARQTQLPFPTSRPVSASDTASGRVGSGLGQPKPLDTQGHGVRNGLEDAPGVRSVGITSAGVAEPTEAPGRKRARPAGESDPSAWALRAKQPATAAASTAWTASVTAAKRGQGGEVGGASGKKAAGEAVTGILVGSDPDQATTAGPRAAAAAKPKRKGAKAVASAVLGEQLRPLSELLDWPGVGGDVGPASPSAASGPVRDASCPKVREELRAVLGGSRLVLLGMLVAACEGPVKQYCSNMQAVAKPQREMLLKARRLLAKDPIAAAELTTSSASGTARPTAHASPAARGGDAVLSFRGVAATEHHEQCVAFAVMCLDEQQEAQLRQGLGGGGPSDKHVLYLVPTPWSAAARPAGTVPGSTGGPVSSGAQPGAAWPATELLGLMGALVTHGSCPVLCCDSKALLRELFLLGWPAPPPPCLRLLDPCLLSWMEQPQLAQRDEREIDCYSLGALCPRYGIDINPPGAPGTARPTERLRRGLLATGRLFEAARQRVQPWLNPAAVQVEMQVSAVLARMECVGMGVDTAGLAQRAAAVRQRMDALSAAAARALGGRQINLGSSAQLATVLYDELRLPPPEAGPGKDRGRTHLTTDEAALKQLAPRHPLPGLVLEYRAMQNVLSKWLEPDWLAPLLGRGGSGAAGPTLPRLSCAWNQTATATGRLSSSSPNMQAVTKYVVDVQMDEAQEGGVEQGGGIDGGGGPASPCRRTLSIVARDAFVAPGGRVLISADYSQIELRLLAHLSGDMRLQELLRRAGVAGDAFRLIASAWLRPGTAPADVSSRDREQAKRVIYGIIYGMTGQGLAQALAEQGCTFDEANSLRASFLRHFAGVQAFISSSQHHAKRGGHVATLLGRRRPLPGLASQDARVRGDAERKVVNTIVQGSAADLIKMAMCVWGRYRHPATAHELRSQPGAPPAQQRQQPHQHNQQQTPHQAAAAPALPQPPAELIAQIHDELMFECDAAPESVRQVVCAVRRIMCGVVQLAVPLVVKVAVGQRWGSMQEMPDDNAAA